MEKKKLQHYEAPKRKRNKERKKEKEKRIILVDTIKMAEFGNLNVNVLSITVEFCTESTCVTLKEENLVTVPCYHQSEKEI